MISIDRQTESTLREILGTDLERVARDALIADAYRTGRLSIGQVARLLNFSIHDAHGFLKDRGIPVGYTASDFEADCESLRELRKSPV